MPDEQQKEPRRSLRIKSEDIPVLVQIGLLIALALVLTFLAR